MGFDCQAALYQLTNSVFSRRKLSCCCLSKQAYRFYNRFHIPTYSSRPAYPISWASSLVTITKSSLAGFTLTGFRLFLKALKEVGCAVSDQKDSGEA